ncbi:MAG TPA: hypothetical protein VNL91_07630 [Thermoanaerobaculia bacterium]|nr:hypothetical protein [Thermoanaerobaculia bacterium]
MLLALLLLASNAFPSPSWTSWMRPDAFRLVVGMNRADAVRVLAASGWKGEETKEGHLLVDYAPNKSLTLGFREGRLHSIRFELFTMLPDIAKAFEEEKAYLEKTFGPPRKLKSKSIVLYDGVLPNVMVTLANDPKSDHGKKGIGVLVVRYYDPR